MGATALFDINADGDDAGFEGAIGQTLTLRLRPPIDSGVNHVRFQVFDPAGFDPNAGIAANPPLASKGAPTLTLNGATSGQSVSPVTVGGNVTVTLPGSNGHSYLIRCVVNGGKRVLSDGTVVTDPALIHHRGVYILTTQGTRKIVASELFEFDPGGWADAVNDLILLGGAPLSTFQPSGVGAHVRQIDGYLNEGISVLSFMSDAHRLAVRDRNYANDNRAAFQAAIDYAIYRNGGGNGAGPRVHIGGGSFRCDGPIHVGYGVGFTNLTVEGEGWHSAYGGGTVIKFTHTNAPGIVVQGGRNVHLKDFAIEGPNYAHVVNIINTIGSVGLDALDMDTWIAPGLSNERYRPHVGVAIDPYSGPRPAQSYPDVDYPPWLGAVPQYDKGASSNTKLENVGIYGFVGGVGQQTCDYDGNGDYTKLERVYCNFCAWGMSWGNSQSRVMHFNDCTMVCLHTALMTSMHGRQQGKPTLLVSACEFSTIIYVMDLGLSFGEGPLFHGCFGEGMYSLGRITGSRTAGGVAFKSCEWGFSWWLEIGVPAVVLDNQSFNLVSFDHVFFFNAFGEGAFHFRSQEFEPARLFEFNGSWTMMRDAASEAGERWAQCAQSGTLGITFTKGSVALSRFAMQCGDRYDVDAAVLANRSFVAETDFGSRKEPLCAYTRAARSLLTANDRGVPITPRLRNISANGGIVAQVGRDIEFVFTGVDTTYLMVHGGDVGDVLICDRTQAVFWVRKRVGDHIHARAQTGYGPTGALLQPLVTDEVFSTVNCRRYMPTLILVGDVAAGSPVITNVGLAGGGFVADIGVHIAQYDFLYVDAETDPVMYPYSAQIASFDSGAHTITMASNFEVTRTRMRLGPFVRLPMPNAA